MVISCKTYNFVTKYNKFNSYKNDHYLPQQQMLEVKRRRMFFRK